MTPSLQRSKLFFLPNKSSSAEAALGQAVPAVVAGVFVDVAGQASVPVLFDAALVDGHPGHEEGALEEVDGHDAH